MDAILGNLGAMVRVIDNRSHLVPPEWIGHTGVVVEIGPSFRERVKFKVKFESAPAGWSGSIFSFDSVFLEPVYEDGDSSEEL